MDILEKARKAESVEDLMKIAEENSIKLEREEAQEYFKKLNPPMGELNDDEIDSVAGGGCSGSGGGITLDVSKDMFYTGRTVHLTNEGHCFGASSNYKPSIYCLKPGCWSRTFHIIKKISDDGKYLIGCNKCDWTYYVMKENIAT